MTEVAAQPVASADHRRGPRLALALAALAVAAMVLLAGYSSQQRAPASPPRVARVGYLGSTALSAGNTARYLDAFRAGLKDLGYVEGDSIAIDTRFADSSEDQLAALAAELVDHQNEVIVLADTRAIRYASRATQTIPLVMAISEDPVGTGQVKSLREPGGNLTGLSTLGTQLATKQLELLKETIPTASRIAVLRNPSGRSMAIQWEGISNTARALQVELQQLDVQEPADFDHAFEAAGREPPDAMLVLPDTLINNNYPRIADFATQQRLPAMGAAVQFVEAGGLMAYTVDRDAMFRRAATYVDKILKGADPGTLPIEQPMQFELIANQTTMEAFGITMPRAVLLDLHRLIQ